VAGHTAGLPLHYHFFYADEPYRPPPMEETIRRYGILVTPPGERYEYSNLGFGILGHVIARAAGVPYADFMRQNVFLPLGLTHTSVHVGAGLNRYAAERYGTDGLRLPPYGFDHDAASAVYASVHDLVRFGMFHLKAHLPDQRRILTDEAIDQMQRGSGYGIGWSLSERSGYAVVQHAGSMGGVSTLLMLVPGEKIAVAAVCNASGSLAAEAAHRAIATLLPKWDARVSSTHAAPVEPPAWQPPPELIGSWSGRLVTWKAEHPFTMRVLESGDVHVRLGAQLRTLLNGVVFEGGVLRGRMHGEVGTEDAGRTRHFLQLALTLRGAVLNGPATSLSVAAPRPGNALTSWLELKKQ
jgi:hypothetical protein